MNHRERLLKALNHEKTDRPPIDLGSSGVSGIHALAYSKLRNALGLEEKPVFVYEALQQLARVDEDVRQALDVDVVGLLPYYNSIGVRNHPLVLKDYPIPQGGMGKCVEGFQYKIDSDGSRYAYPQGNTNYPPSYKMPAGGYFFDPLNRSDDTVDDETDPYEDFGDSFGVMSEEEGKFYAQQVKQLKENTDYGIVFGAALASFGDLARIPGPNVLQPKGIRGVDEWLIAHKLRPEYVYAVNEINAKAVLKSYEVLYQAVGNDIDVLFVSGTDFGTQNGPMISHDDFCKLYKPFYKQVNDWIHNNTKWKIMYHSCGSIVEFIDDFVEIGVDILNPVQCSAKGMDAKYLKDKYGDKLVFWGGGIDTQKTLPFGTPDECRAQVRERIETLGAQGGFVFNSIHNIQANTPVENLLAIFEEARKIVK